LVLVAQDKQQVVSTALQRPQANSLESLPLVAVAAAVDRLTVQVAHPVVVVDQVPLGQS
jgi:hypothetical protein